MKKFEYHLLTSDSSFFSGIDAQELTAKLNMLGQQGWELVTVTDVATATSRAQGVLITLRREVA